MSPPGLFFHRGWLAAPTAMLSYLLINGFTGVSLFFLLSGFILAHTYLTPDGRWRGTVRAFYVARIARIYPAYLAALVVALGPFLWYRAQYPQPFHPLVTGLAALSLTQAWIPTSTFLWNAPGWSLSAEVFFYATFPFFAVALARCPGRLLLPILAALWGIEYWLGLLPWGGPVLGQGFFAIAPQQVVLDHNPILRLPEFLMGVACGRLYQHYGALPARRSPSSS